MTGSTTLERPPATPAVSRGGEAKRPPVKKWAIFGAVVIAINLFVWGRWMTGPLFEEVPTGPSDPPTWMKAVLITWQAVGIPVALGLLYFLLIRPWRREGVVKTDGLLVVAFAFMCFQEPLWSYFGHWFTYNSYLVNFGSWVNSVPGASSYASPGAMMVEPFLWIAPVYPVVFLTASWTGAWALRTGRRRWPNLSNPALVVFVLFPTMVVFDILLEGLLFMPLGFYAYAGGIGPSMFPEAYHKFPLHIALSGGVLFSAIAALRYFKNDRGETLVERGVNSLRLSTPRKAVLRFLALAGACQLIFFLTAALPHAALVGPNSSDWPEDLQSRSYFLDGLCGEGTGRSCPPDQGRANPIVPFEDGDAPPFNGPFFSFHGD